MSVIVKSNKNKQDQLDKLLNDRVKNPSLITSMNEFITYHGLDYWYNIATPIDKNICEYLYSFHKLTFDKKLLPVDINIMKKEDIDRISELALLIVVDRDYAKLGAARTKIINDFKKISHNIDIQIYKKSCITKKYDVVQIYLDIFGKQQQFINDTKDVIDDVKLIGDIKMKKILEKYYIN